MLKCKVLAFGNRTWPCIPVGVCSLGWMLSNCGRRYLQTFSDWPKKETKLCPAHLTILSVFIGKEVELVSGISLCAGFKGPEGLY